MIRTSDQFRADTARALHDDNLKISLTRTTGLLQRRRAQVVDDYLDTTLRAILDGHPQSGIEDLMPWRYAPPSSLTA